MLSTAALLCSAEQQAVSQVLSAPKQHPTIQLRAVVINTTKSSYLKQWHQIFKLRTRESFLCMHSTAALLCSAEQQAVSQVLTAPQQHPTIQLRAVVINTTKNSLTFKTTYNLAKHKEMLCYLFNCPPSRPSRTGEGDLQAPCTSVQGI